MQKIPSLFVRDWNGDRSRVTREVNPECQWVIDGEGRPTRKWDGTAVRVEDGRLWKRYDAKKGKQPPPGFEPAQEPDPVTGHHPGWVPVGDEPESKWHRAAFDAVHREDVPAMEGHTFELCGPHFQGNPEAFAVDILVKHGAQDIEWTNGGPLPRDFDGIAHWLYVHPMEGLVWHHPDGRMAKIKRSDFGLPWPVKTAESEAA